MKSGLTKCVFSTAFLGAVSYFAGYYNIIAMILLFILISVLDVEDDAKKNAAQAMVLCMLFTIVGTIFSQFDTWYTTLTGKIPYGTIYNIISKLNIFDWIVRILNFIEKIVMIILVFLSFKGKCVKIPVISGIVNGHFEKKADAE